MVSEGAHGTVSWHPSRSTDIGLSCLCDCTPCHLQSLSSSDAKLDRCSLLEKPVVALRYHRCRRSVSAGGLRSRGLGLPTFLDQAAAGVKRLPDSEAASRC